LTAVGLTSKETLPTIHANSIDSERDWQSREDSMAFRLNAQSSRVTPIIVLTLAFSLSGNRLSFALDEVKIHVAGTPNITSFVYHVGKEKGFYR
jgi:hypothetical protein